MIQNRQIVFVQSAGFIFVILHKWYIIQNHMAKFVTLYKDKNRQIAQKVKFYHMHKDICSFLSHYTKMKIGDAHKI